MKTELESQDIEAIAERIIELLKPMLSDHGGQKEQDINFDVGTLAEYLKVEESWVYKQVHLNAIPHFKAGKYTRFKKKDIDRWIDSQKIPSSLPLKLVKKGEGR